MDALDEAKKIWERMKQAGSGIKQAVTRFTSDYPAVALNKVNKGIENIKYGLSNVAPTYSEAFKTIYKTPNQALNRVASAYSNVPLARQNIQPLLKKTAPIIQYPTNFLLNTGQTITSGYEDIIRGGQNTYSGIKNKSKLDVAAGLTKTVMGLGKTVTPMLPSTGMVFQGANLLASSPWKIGTVDDPGMISPLAGGNKNRDQIRRLAAGVMQGQTGINSLAPNVPSQTTKLPFLGDVDLLKGVGSLYGFTKNPVWEKIFPVTRSFLNLNPTTNKVLNFLFQRSEKGGVEGMIQGLSQITPDMSTDDKIMTLIQNVVFGSVSEIGTDAALIGSKKIFNSLPATAKKSLSEFIDKSSGEIRKLGASVNTMEIDPKTGKRVSMPMWLYKFKELTEKIGLQVRPIKGSVLEAQAAKDAAKGAQPPLGDVQPKGVGVLKTAKEPISPQVDSQVPQVGGNQGSSYKPSITQVSNPTDPYFNVNRLNVKPEVKQAVKTAVMDSKPQIEKVVGKTLTNKEVIDVANRTASTIRKVATRDETMAWEASLLKARQKLAMDAQNGTLTQEFLDNLLTVKSQGTDIARKLQSMGIDADPKNATAKQVMLEAVAKVEKDASKILAASKGVDFNDFQQATAFYRKFIQPTKEEWMDTLRYNAMLSSPNTHINNISSNIQGTGIVAPIEKTLTGTLDWMRSAVTGQKRQYFAGEGIEYAKGYYGALNKARKRFADVMSGKLMGEYPEMRDIPLTTKGIKRAGENVLKYPQRLLEAADQFFTTLTSSGVERQMGYRAGKGVNVGNISEKAANEAQYRLFRGGFGRAEEGPVLKALEYLPQKIMEAKRSNNPLVRLSAKLSFPFVRIATNLFKQGIEYSPAGVVTIKGAKEKLPQLSKAIMGSIAGLGAAMLASSNRITWSRPTSKKQQELWDQAGMQEYSVKVGDKWYSYTKMHPLIAFNFATVAGVKQMLDKSDSSDDVADKTLTALGNIMRFYADQSYVKNIGDFLNSVEQGSSALPKMASNYIQQFVPFRAFSGWLARTLDPYQRTTTPDANAIQKQMEYFLMQIPGLRQTLPAKTGITGEPIENKNRFINAVSPARVTTGVADYESAYNVAKNKSKLDDLKKQAISLYASGDKQGAKKIAEENNITLTNGDIKTYKASVLKKAADLYIEEKKDEAKKLTTDNQITMTNGDVKKAAKRKAVELYRLGLKKQAKAIVDKYGITLTNKDVK